MVYDDNFTTVPYLRTGKVPPHWDKLVQESAHFDRVDNQKDTWQSLQLGEACEGGFTGDRDDTQPTSLINAESNVVNQETAHLSEEFVSSGYNFETKATQSGNESSDRICVTQPLDSTLDSKNLMIVRENYYCQ